MASKRKQRITPHALLEIRTPGDIHLSPDGARVAFVVDETDWEENEQTHHLFVGATGSTSPGPSSRGESTKRDSPEPARQVTHGKAVDSYPRWSPDGKHLAFLRTPHEDEDDDTEDGDSRAQAWVLPMDGLGGEARKITDAKEGVEILDWLPDSKGLVYLAREPRPKTSQAALDGRVDDNDDAVVDREDRWRQQIWRIDLEHKKAHLVHGGDYGIGEIAVSPDGALVAFSTNYTGEPNDYHKADIWTVSLGTSPQPSPLERGQTEPVSATLAQLTEGPGGKFHPQWSPDGARVYFVRTLDPDLSYSQENLYSVAREGGPVEHETADFPHDLTGWHGFQFDDAGALYVSVALGTSTAVYVRRSAGSTHLSPSGKVEPDGQGRPSHDRKGIGRTDLTGPGEIRGQANRFEPLIDNDEHIHEFSVARNGAVAYVSSAIDDAPEVLFLAPDAKGPVRLSDLNGDWMDDYEIAPVDLVKWTSTGGLEIEALITYPLGYDPEKRYPLVVSVHGGPHGRSVQALTSNSLSQVLAADGFAVLSPNYRGSEGYGNEFSTANRGDLGGGDFEDILAGVDWAVLEGIADADRIGIMGSSYGGYLVNWAIAKSRRFKAAVSAFGIFSLISDFSNSEAPRWESEYLGGAYWEAPDEYHRRSPSTYAKDIDTPVLILHGDDDSNTVITNSLELYNALRLQGKTAQFVRYPGEGHGFYEPMHRIDEMRRCRAWFDKYLVGDGAASTYRLGDRIEHGGLRLTVARADIETYALAPKTGRRHLEVQFTMSGSREPLTFVPADIRLARASKNARSSRPVGIPIDVLGQNALAVASNWRLRFDLGKDETEINAAVAVAFRITDAGGSYVFTVKDFPSVTLDIAPADIDEDEPKREQQHVVKPAR